MSLVKKLFCVAAVAGFATAAHGETIKATIHLKEKVSLQELANSVTTPGGARYGQPYTPEEILRVAGPSDSDYANTIQQLKDEGFKIVGETKTHLWISVEGDSALYSRTFQAQFQKNAKDARKLQSAAQVPVFMYMIDSVSGLETRPKAHPMYRLKKDQPNAAAPGGVSPTTVKTVYGFNSIYASGVNGTGQHIAIATYDDFNVSDVQSYYTQMKISPAPTVDKVPFNGTPNMDENSAMETELDAEFSGMMAPGANVHVFSSATNDDAGEVQMFTAILDDNRAKIVNYSWGMCESGVSAQHVQDMAKIYTQAVAQGVNIMVASGDSGSDGCQDGTTTSDWPASAPQLVAVGGTTLKVSGSTGTETGWSGSGGGISTLYGLPDFQNAHGIANKGRSFPDVAFNADPASGQAIYARQNGKPGWFVIGGTSMAAPQWSGFMALVGNARKAKNLSTVGFLNPIIYALSADQAKTLFNDVTSGSNGAYSAAVGWDTVTGLGSMKAQALLNYLTQ